MKLFLTFSFFILSSLLVTAQSYHAFQNISASSDWLIKAPSETASIYKSADGKDIILNNGLLNCAFRIFPNVACVDFKNLTTNQQLLRAVKAEAIIDIDGHKYNIGGLHGQKENAYLLPEWVDNFTANDNDFRFTDYVITDLKPYLNWKPGNWWASNKKQPTGKSIIFKYYSELTMLKGLMVQVHYDIFDGIPLVAKYVTIENKGTKAYKINRVINENLAVVEEESAVVGSTELMKRQHGIYVETNYAFNNAMNYHVSDQTTHWLPDSSYTSQVNYNCQTPALLQVYEEKAPGIDLNPGENFESVRTYELLQDSYDRERRGLAIRKMYRTIAPWVTENPIFMHLVSKNDSEVYTAIDQCAETGYEALILSFGSHLNMEDSSAKNLSKWKTIADYAHKKGIKIGGYSLFSSRKISPEDDVINPNTGKPGGAFFGSAPCFGSKWGLTYRDKMEMFFTKTGFDIWENDGPYPGDVCASTTHPGHKGLDDSQWRQMEIQKELYHWLNARGVYINAPDWYFLDGTNKIALGYREVNFSLPRENQKILNRQNIFDGTWEKTPSMGWGFVPLTRYQGGGPEAILEPLSEHLNDYKQLMVEYYGAGIQACYRGPRLYDTETTKQTVINVIDWYKKYRDILNSDIIHLRRPDGRDWDGILHVNPDLKTKGFLLVYNPLKTEISRTISLPLYYTGLTSKAIIFNKDGKSAEKILDRNYKVEFTFTVAPESYEWFVIE